MKVMVTGGTGFVGYHVCQQLRDLGLEVRLLVRSLEKARAIYGEPSIELEYVVGDITDAASVEAALAGCDALVHAAAGTPLQTKSADEMFAVNVGGVKNVVAAALKHGIERIVCISSITAVFNRDGNKITPESPPTPSAMPYGQSKVEAELYLRQLQEEGAPIAIIYPGGVIGPDDPGISDTCRAMQHRIENGFRIFGDGGMQHVDVRDLAAFVCSLVQTGGSGRFLLPGVYVKWTELADIVEAVSGCELQRIPAQGWKLRMVGRMIDIVRKFRSVDTPVSAETMRYATLWPNIRNTDELAKRGLALRDPTETFRDAISWMVREGHLDASRCPKCV
ncbi:MAG: dihydroflavonol-4-reductase [Bacteroidia bacterium]|jgi:dihydroflavonol-4-reductase